MQLIVLLGLLAAAGVAQDCIPYGSSVSLTGKLVLKDEAGYNQYIALQLTRPICSRPGPGESEVLEIQAGVYRDDANSEEIRDRLHRLVEHDVVIRGILFDAHNGYHRTKVQWAVESVDAVDVAGRQALLVPVPSFKARDVGAYDVTIHAGPRLVIEAYEAGTATSLQPGAEYLRHWMTGGEVMWADCLDGYDRHLVSSTAPDGGYCFDDDLCGFSAFPTKAIVIKLRCTKTDRGKE